MTAFYTKYNAHVREHLMYSGKYRIKVVAVKMADVMERLHGERPKAPSLHNYVEDRSQFPADLVGPLAAATEDPRFLDPVVFGTPFKVVRRAEATGQAEKGIELEFMDVTIAHGKLLEHFNERVADRLLDAHDAISLMSYLDEMDRENHDIRNKLQGIVDAHHQQRKAG